MESKELVEKIIKYSYQIIKENYNVENVILFLDYFTLIKSEEVLIRFYAYQDIELNEYFEFENTKFKLSSIKPKEFDAVKTNVLLLIAKRDNLLYQDLKDKNIIESLEDKIYYDGAKPKNFLSILLNEEKEIRDEIFLLKPNDERIERCALAFKIISGLITQAFFDSNDDNFDFEKNIERNLKLKNEKVFGLIEESEEEYLKNVFESLKTTVNQTIFIHEDLLKYYNEIPERNVL